MCNDDDITQVECLLSLLALLAVSPYRSQLEYVIVRSRTDEDARTITTKHLIPPNSRLIRYLAAISISEPECAYVYVLKSACMYCM
jgi:hypothetical protein